MQIDHNILITYGGTARKVAKGEFIFYEGATPHFFYQVIEGEIKLFSTNSEGKELIQGIFKAGQSFGEPPLLLGRCYPSTAQASTASVIVKIGKERLINILKDYHDVADALLHTFAERIYQKATSAQMWISPTPEEKIFHFLKNLRSSSGQDLQHIPYTRQQIADFTGLRVETVIRTLTRMDKEGKVKIIDHKLYY